MLWQHPTRPWQAHKHLWQQLDLQRNLCEYDSVEFEWNGDPLAIQHWLTHCGLVRPYAVIYLSQDWTI